jgi:hypothetical protein
MRRILIAVSATAALVLAGAGTAMADDHFHGPRDPRANHCAYNAHRFFGLYRLFHRFELRRCSPPIYHGPMIHPPVPRPDHRFDHRFDIHHR